MSNLSTEVMGKLFTKLGRAGVGTQELQSLFSSGLLDDVLRCSEPRGINREAFSEFLKRPESVLKKEWIDLEGKVKEYLALAASARSDESCSSKLRRKSWEHHMRKAVEEFNTLRMETNDVGQLDGFRRLMGWIKEHIWREAQLYMGLAVFGWERPWVEEPWIEFRDRLRNLRPCDACYWRGKHEQGTACAMCSGKGYFVLAWHTCELCGGACTKGGVLASLDEPCRNWDNARRYSRPECQVLLDPIGRPPIPEDTTWKTFLPQNLWMH